MPRQNVGEKFVYTLRKTKPNPIKTINELKQNGKNLNKLSKIEICSLWDQIHTILLDAEKYCIKVQEQNISNQKEEYLSKIKVIRMIIALALDTIEKNKRISIIFQNITYRLHSITFVKIHDAQVKDDISKFFEHWWILDKESKSNLIINPLKHLIRHSQTSIVHLQRLYRIRSALIFIKDKKDIEILLNFVKNKPVISSLEKNLLIYLFTLGEEWITNIHNIVKSSILNAEARVVTNYAELYASAWLEVNNNDKALLVKHCFENIIFHYLRANRYSPEGVCLVQNIFTFLNVFNNYQNESIRRVIYSQYNHLLWDHLQAPSSLVRYNAANLLFLIYPIQYVNKGQLQHTDLLEKQHKAMTKLLLDSDIEVCCIVIKGIINLLEKDWDKLSQTDLILEWFNILSNHTKNSNSQIKKCIFLNLKTLMSHEPRSKEFLSTFSNSIFDEDVQVLVLFIDLLIDTHDEKKTPFWNIVPCSSVMNQLENATDEIVVNSYIKLIHFCIPLKDENQMVSKITDVGILNKSAIQKFFLHSKHVGKNTCMKLIKVILTSLENPRENLLENQLVKRSKGHAVKKQKIRDNKENQQFNGNFDTYSEICDINETLVSQLLIDIVLVLFEKSQLHLKKNDPNVKEKNFLSTIGNIIVKMYKKFEKTSVRDSIILLLSFVPYELLPKETLILHTLETELFNSDLPEDTMFTILLLLQKWRKMSEIFVPLLKLIEELKNECSQENFLRMHEFKLIVRILRHLLSSELQSIIINEYHSDLCRLWNDLDVVKCFIEMTLNNANALPEDFTIEFFYYYISLISILHKTDIFNASTRFAQILSWIVKIIIPNVSSSSDSNLFPIKILKIIFRESILLIKKCQIPTKSYCDIVLFYCNCMMLPRGISFINNALNSMEHLLEVGRIASKNKDFSLLKGIIPKLLSAVMITLVRSSEDTIITETNNLNLLFIAVNKYYEIIESIPKKQHIVYLGSIFNTCVVCIGRELKQLLNDDSLRISNILDFKFSYLEDKLLQIILNLNKHKDVCLEILIKALRRYSQFEILAALLMVRKIFQHQKEHSKDLANVLKTAHYFGVTNYANNRFIVNAIEKVIEILR